MLSKRQLALVGAASPDLELALEVAQDQVGQVVGALVGLGEVGRQRGVAARARPACQPPGRQRQHRALGVVQRLGRTDRPARRRATARPPASSSLNATTPRRCHRLPARSPCTSPVPRRQVPWTCTPTRSARRRVLRPASRPERPVPGGCRRARSRSRRPPPRTPAREQPVAQDPELQAVEELCAPPGGPTAAWPGPSALSGRSRSRTSALSRRLRSTSSRCAGRLRRPCP